MVSFRLVAWRVVSLAVLTSPTALLAEAQDPSAPSALEQALIENECTGVLPRGALDTDDYRHCLKARLASLRADFGHDLELLTGAERNDVDAACTGLRSAGREAYLECLDAQLGLLAARRKPAANAASVTELAAPGPAVAQAADPQAPARQSWSGVALMGTTLGLAIVGVTGARLFFKPRRPRCTCRECGVELASAGNLCAACRHQAAESRRRAAASQTSDENDEADEAVGPVPEPQPPEPEVPGDPSIEAAVTAHGGEPVPPRVQEALINPYVVLGILPDATPDEIRAAYEDARSKFDPNRVSHLGAEVQRYFKAKALAVDRAYQQLV